MRIFWNVTIFQHVEEATESKVVRRQASFPTKHRVKHTCEPYGRNKCEIYIRHCQGTARNRSQGGRGPLLEGAFPLRLSPLFPLLGAGLLLRGVKTAATVGLWLPRASQRASAAGPGSAKVVCKNHNL